jgi:hypothetical protein
MNSTQALAACNIAHQEEALRLLDQLKDRKFASGVILRLIAALRDLPTADSTVDVNMSMSESNVKVQNRPLLTARVASR